MVKSPKYSIHVSFSMMQGLAQAWYKPSNRPFSKMAAKISNTLQ